MDTTSLTLYIMAGIMMVFLIITGIRIAKDTKKFNKDILEKKRKLEKKYELDNERQI